MKPQKRFVEVGHSICTLKEKYLTTAKAGGKGQRSGVAGIWGTGAVSAWPRTVKQPVWLMDCKNIVALGYSGHRGLVRVSWKQGCTDQTMGDSQCQTKNSAFSLCSMETPSMLT